MTPDRAALSPSVERVAGVIAEIATTFDSAEGMDARITHALALLGQLVPNDRAALLLRGSDGTHRVLTSPTLDQGSHGPVVLLLDSLWHFTEADLYDHGPFRAASHLALPVVGGERTIGVLLVQCDTHQYEYEPYHVSLMSAVASQLGSYVTASRLHAQVSAHAEALGRREKDLSNATRRLQELLRQMPAGVAMVDAPHGAPVLVNDLARALLDGSDVGQGCGNWEMWRPSGEPLPADEQPLMRALRSGVVTTDAEIQLRHPDGTAPVILANAGPIRDVTGQIVAAVMAFVDISQRKAYEDELRRVARFREEFIGVVAHDFRSPLAAALTGAHMLVKCGELDSLQVRTARRIQNSAERMSHMIDELVDFTRGRLGGGIPINKTRVALDVICRHAIDEQASVAPGRSIQLTTTGDVWGDWDGRRLSQVFANLIGNAITHGGEVTPVRVTLTGSNEAVTIEVTNDGPAIPTEHLPALFEPFCRRTTNERDTSGLGLGLYIVERIARAHGGKVAARSSATEGTTFVVVLPRTERRATRTDRPSVAERRASVRRKRHSRDRRLPGRDDGVTRRCTTKALPASIHPSVSTRM